MQCYGCIRKQNVSECKRKNTLAFKTDTEKNNHINNKRDENLKGMSLEWYPAAYLTFCMIGYGCTLLQNHSVASVLNTNSSFGYQTDATSGAYTNESSEASKVKVEH